jgi:hypothetical protein
MWSHSCAARRVRAIASPHTLHTFAGKLAFFISTTFLGSFDIVLTLPTVLFLTLVRFDPAAPVATASRAAFRRYEAKSLPPSAKIRRIEYH